MPGVDSQLLNRDEDKGEEKGGRREVQAEAQDEESRRGKLSFLQRSRRRQKQMKRLMNEIDFYQKEMKKADFSGFTFYGMLFVAVCKELLDVIALSFVGSALNIFFAMIFGLFMILNTSKLKRIVRRMQIKYFFSVVVEFFPFINFAPTYLIAILLMKRDANNEVKKLKEEIRSRNKKLKKLQKAYA